MLGQVDELEPDLVRERADQIDLRDVAAFDQQSTQRLARILLGCHCRVQICLAQQTLLTQQHHELRPVGHWPSCTRGSDEPSSPSGLPYRRNLPAAEGPM